MKDGFVNVITATPKVKVADVAHNGAEIEKIMREVTDVTTKLVVFPELSLTGATCGDLFFQLPLLRDAKKELTRLVKVSEDLNGIFFVGLPWEHRGKLVNAAAVFEGGQLLGIVPKTYLPDTRNFTAGKKGYEYIDFEGEMVPFGTSLLFTCEDSKDLVIAVEIGEDLWAPNPPSTSHALHGATVIVNLAATYEGAGRSDYRRQLISGQSARLNCAYIHVNAGYGESTTDYVFDGQSLVAENGVILMESPKFQNAVCGMTIDVELLSGERRRNTNFVPESPVDDDYLEVDFTYVDGPMLTSRQFEQSPFVPSGKTEWAKRCEELLCIQAMGLKKRLEHTWCDHAVIGISGGLDSTLALIVTALAYDFLGKPRSCIHAVTMPCFGTTDRTYNNACELTRRLGAELQEVDIKNAVRTHFADIGQDENKHDVTFENAQARERTQVLMDIANQLGGMVIGTGDLSELALGWATYNGDHMSMYSVNGGIPKTLVRHLVRYYAETCKDEKLAEILFDVLDTPVSPELLPPKDGEIAQKTEDLVGPYELHDFFLYYILRYGFAPRKIYFMATSAFTGVYDKETIKKWLQTFYRRFFAQQFKRSCLPDGPKVGSIGVSPRGDLRMPSDACAALWLAEVEKLD